MMTGAKIREPYKDKKKREQKKSREKNCEIIYLPHLNKWEYHTLGYLIVKIHRIHCSSQMRTHFLPLQIFTQLLITVHRAEHVDDPGR